MQIKIQQYTIMVKNLSTVERSTKIRFGKNCTDDQGENTIVFNASNEQIDTSTPGAIYMTPIRENNDPNSYLMLYDTVTKEIKNSGVLASQALGIPSLEEVTAVGNTTTSNVGIANTQPQHLLSVSNAMYVSNTGIYKVIIPESADIGSLKVGPSILLNGTDALNQVQVSGRMQASDVRVDNRLAIDNTGSTHHFYLGDKLFMNKDASTILQTTRDISARKYLGDGGSLSNLSLENIVNRGNTISNTLILTNSNISLTTQGDILVGNVLTTNVLKVNDLSVGYVPIVTDNKVLTDSVIQAPSTGTLRMDADVSIYGNLTTYGNVTQISANNLTVGDPLILLGNNNPLDTNDLGVIMKRPTANVAMGFRGDESEFMIGYTHSDASGITLSPLTTKDIDVKVYGNVEAKKLTSNTTISTNIYGTVRGSNTISASTITATTLNANVVADTIHGEIQGSNTISASTITATTLNANVVADTIHGEIQGANTISASTITATTLNANVVADTIHGEIQGSNTISASTITATTLNANVVADTIHGEIQGSNTISASTITATTLNANVVADTIHGEIQGSNTISASTITATTLNANVVADTIHGEIQGSNTISASTITATTLMPM
jgi:hypothetical protein